MEDDRQIRRPSEADAENYQTTNKQLDNVRREAAADRKASSYEIEKYVPDTIVNDREQFEGLEDLETKAGRNGAYRMYSQKILLIYPGHLDEAKLMTYICKLKCSSPLLKPRSIHCVNKAKTKCVPYRHTQCLVDFGKAFQTKNRHFFDYTAVDTPQSKTYHPVIYPIPTINHWRVQMECFWY